MSYAFYVRNYPTQVDFEQGKGLMLSSMSFSFLLKRKDLGVFRFIALSYTSWTLSSPFFLFSFTFRRKELNVKEFDIPHYCSPLGAICLCHSFVCVKEKVSEEMCVSSR